MCLLSVLLLRLLRLLTLFWIDCLFSCLFASGRLAACSLFTWLCVLFCFGLFCLCLLCCFVICLFIVFCFWFRIYFNSVVLIDSILCFVLMQYVWLYLYLCAYLFCWYLCLIWVFLIWLLSLLCFGLVFGVLIDLGILFVLYGFGCGGCLLPVAVFVLGGWVCVFGYGGFLVWVVVYDLLLPFGFVFVVFSCCWLFCILDCFGVLGFSLRCLYAFIL